MCVLVGLLLGHIDAVSLFGFLIYAVSSMTPIFYQTAL